MSSTLSVLGTTREAPLVLDHDGSQSNIVEGFDTTDDHQQMDEEECPHYAQYGSVRRIS